MWNAADRCYFFVSKSATSAALYNGLVCGTVHVLLRCTAVPALSLRLCFGVRLALHKSVPGHLPFEPSVKIIVLAHFSSTRQLHCNYHHTVTDTANYKHKHRHKYEIQ